MAKIRCQKGLPLPEVKNELKITPGKPLEDRRSRARKSPKSGPTTISAQFAVRARASADPSCNGSTMLWRTANTLSACEMIWNISHNQHSSCAARQGRSSHSVFNAAQRKLHEIIEEQKRKSGRVRVVVLKARQMGVSTYVAARFYSKTIQCSRHSDTDRRARTGSITKSVSDRKAIS